MNSFGTICFTSVSGAFVVFIRLLKDFYHWNLKEKRRVPLGNWVLNTKYFCRRFLHVKKSFVFAKLFLSLKRFHKNMYDYTTLPPKTFLKTLARWLILIKMVLCNTSACKKILAISFEKLTSNFVGERCYVRNIYLKLFRFLLKTK